MALRQAKLAMVAAHEHGERDALARAMRSHPAEADALSDFAVALLATETYQDEEITPDVSVIGAAARSRAFAAVFGPVVADVVVAPQASLSLKALRQARGVTLSAAAKALGLGVDVLSALEAGRIRIATTPRRLADSLALMLDATANEIGAALGAQMAPALRRGALDAASGASDADAQLDFAEAVRLSQSMSDADKAGWLAADDPAR
jgi:hypothetical protein